MAEPVRVMLFAPRLPASESLHFALRLARHGRPSAGALHACFRARDPIAGEVPLRPDSPALPELPAGDEQTGSASLADFAALTRPGAPPFDVLLLPHAWLALPSGGPSAQPPAPVVARVPHFAYFDSDYGLITDNARKGLDKLLASASTFVFPSSWLRDKAVSRHGFPPERCQVILPSSGHDGRPLDVDAARRRYQLPPRFVLIPPLMKRGHDGAAILDAMRALRDRLGLSLPLLSLGPVLDECSGNPLAGTWEGRACLERLEEARSGRSYRALGPVSPDDWHAVVAAASCVLVLGDDLPEVPILALDALAVGTPLVYRESPVFAEALPAGGVALPRHAEASRVAEAVRAAVEGPRPGRVLPRTAAEEASAYLALAGRLTGSRWRRRPRRAARPTAGRDGRVAWLINHTTLRAFEVPLIRSLGLEVYSSKVIPDHTDFMSGSVDYSDDEDSTLPAWALDLLNRHNFYEKAVTPEVLEVINGYFGTVISNYFGPNLASLVKGYTGRMVVRVFGREHPNNYSGYMSACCGRDYWENVWRMGERFWLGACYETIPDIEETLLRQRTLYLPLGMPEAAFRPGHTWRGSKPRILFVCPRINTEPPYYLRIYRAFKEAFGDLPHVIAGRQPTPVDDGHVTGALDEDAYRHLFDESRVMFYHSREPRHLHYHPLEAIARGMPVVYMRGGVLEQYGGSDQPGACETLAEAREKVERLLAGDEELAARIVAAQDVLIERFRYDYNRRVWEEQFVGRVLATPLAPDTRTVLPSAKDAATSAPPAAERRLSPPERPLRLWVDLPGVDEQAYDDARDFVAALARSAGRDWSFTHAPPHTSAPPEDSGRRETIAARLERLAFRSGSRVLRGAARGALSAVYYTRAAREQGTLRPRGSGALDVLPWRLARLLGADVSDRFRADPAPEEIDYQRAPPGRRPEEPLPAPHAPLSLEEIDRQLEDHDALLITHPFRRLDPNLALEAARERPVAVVVRDLAQEYTGAWGAATAAVRREMVLWLRLARVVICTSEFLRGEVLRRYAVEPGKVRVIANPLLEEDDRPIGGEEVRGALARLNVPGRYLIAPGDLDPGRNHLTALRALAALRRRGVAAPPLLLTGRWRCGDGSAYAREWRRFLRESGLREGVEYRMLDGRSDGDRAALIAGASACLAVGSWQAELDRATLQAVAREVPLITSRLPCVTERLGEDETNALLVAADDHEAVADAIEEVLARPEAAGERARRAARLARRWSWEQAARAYEEALREAAAEGHGGLTRRESAA